MTLNPDWEALNQLNFMLAPRISAPLNEALNALTLADLPENQVDPQVWRDKAKAAIANVLSLYQAWSVLIQYKNGQTLPPNTNRPFTLQAILDWLTVQLELVPPARAKENITLEGVQACIQEAILLLHSVGATQGSAVHVGIELANNGAWFKVRFSRHIPLPETIDQLLNQFTSHWRSQDAAFELKMALDLIRINHSRIELHWDKEEKIGEFAFFIYKSGVNRQLPPGIPATPETEHARFVANLTRLLLKQRETPIIEPSELGPPAASEEEKPTVMADPTTMEKLSPSPQPAEGQDETTLKAEGEETRPVLAKESLSEAFAAHLKRDPSGTKGTSLLQELRNLDQQRKQGTPSVESPIPDHPAPAATDEQAKTQALIVSATLSEPEPPTVTVPVSDATQEGGATQQKEGSAS